MVSDSDKNIFIEGPNVCDHNDNNSGDKNLYGCYNFNKLSH